MRALSISGLTIQNLLFETSSAASFQERLQFKKYFLLSSQPSQTFNSHLARSQNSHLITTIPFGVTIQEWLLFKE